MATEGRGRGGPHGSRTEGSEIKIRSRLKEEKKEAHAYLSRQRTQSPDHGELFANVSSSLSRLPSPFVGF